MNTQITISAVDYHTAGEPFRIISGGVPANISVEVVFGSLTECIRSAHVGEVWRDEGLWAGD